uniref:Peptide-methionine (S)-S-oxide reductase n=2 Tax=Panagrolaimus sp. JU765 TaxID=591449 RepID=A0AC34RKC3_9BILA
MPLKKAVFGLQCFWGESALAKIDGVVKTRVGYAGGTAPKPTYQNIQDYTEVIEATFDDQKISYQDLLDYFWTHHDPTDHRKKQYRSAILYSDDEQKTLAEASFNKVKAAKPSIETYVQKLDHFYVAEDYHQKYWLRCQPRIFNALNLTDEQVIDSPLAAKMNAFMAGYDNFDVLQQLKKEYNLDDGLVKAVEDIAKRGGDPRACH